jgi:hypothetical protein
MDIDRPAVVDGRLDPSVFQTWVYFPLIRSALYRNGGVLVHAAAAEIDGRRVAFTGWGGAGKTWVLLELLRRGAHVLADDWMTLGSDGVASPATGHLEIQPFQWDRTAGGRWPGRPQWLRSATVGAAGWASQRLRRSASLSRGLSRVAEAWHPDTAWVRVQEAFPASRVAKPGPLDAIVVLVPPGAEAPPATSVPELVALQTQTFLSDHAALEAALRYAFPGRSFDAMFPSAQEEVELATKGLSGTRVGSVAFDPMSGDVARAADEVVDAGG